jgi:hypothetical protein
VKQNLKKRPANNYYRARQRPGDGRREEQQHEWAVEVNGPSRFLTSRAPTGATLLKLRHLELLDHTLVIVRYWEWDGCRGTGVREQYLRGKLAPYVQTPSQAHKQTKNRFDDEFHACKMCDMIRFTHLDPLSVCLCLCLTTGRCQKKK